jgi:outer membrane protein assembly factor BamB
VSAKFAAAAELLSVASENNWPQWRGPTADGLAATAHPPLEWSETKNVKWKVPIPGEGSATPIVWGDQIFIHTAIATGRKAEAAKPDDNSKSAESTQPVPKGAKGGMPGVAAPDEYYQFVLLCLDRRNGKELWRNVVREEVPHEGHHPDHGYASYSPATDGTCVVSYFGSHGLHVYDMQGKLKWEKDLGKMKTIFGFGEATSPVLSGNTIVINWDHEGDDFIAAFNKETGNELWRTPREGKTTWATPLVVPVDGKMQVIVPGAEKTRAYDLATGQQVWECAGLTFNCIPSPVAVGGMVYVTTGYNGSALLAIRLSGSTGDLTGTDAVVWKVDKDTPYVPSPLVYNGRLYCFKLNNSILSCFDAASGNRLFGPERLDGLGDTYASPVGADNRIYLVGRNGTTMVLRSGDKLDVLATNKLDEPIDASPALVGKQIFLRGKKSLYCIEDEK